MKFRLFCRAVSSPWQDSAALLVPVARAIPPPSMPRTPTTVAIFRVRLMLLIRVIHRSSSSPPTLDTRLIRTVRQVERGNRQLGSTTEQKRTPRGDSAGQRRLRPAPQSPRNRTGPRPNGRGLA